jgi:Ni,Fe-hydrogenase I cytochrome b subunit
VPAAGVVIVFATTVSYGIGWAIGVPPLVPALNTLASFPFMVASLRRGDVHAAVGRMLLWALTMGITATVLSYAYPAETESLFLRSGDYRREMFTWVLTGRGAESTPSIFIPQQAGHAALFSALALATGGVVAMPMGAVLMNYMGHYVGTLAAMSRHPAPLLLLGWHPWAVIRVISFVVLGVVLSVPLLSRLFRFRVDRSAARRLAAWAGCGLLADIVLKTLLAPAWQRLLLRALG